MLKCRQLMWLTLKNFTENIIIAKQGGIIAGDTRKTIEAKTGKRIMSNSNAKKSLTNRSSKK